MPLSEEAKKKLRALGFATEDTHSGNPKSLEETFAHHCSPIGDDSLDLVAPDSRPKKDSEH